MIIIIMTTYQFESENKQSFSNINQATVNSFGYSPTNKKTFSFPQSTTDSQSYRELLAEVKKKDARISVLLEKVKKSEETLQNFRSKSNELEFSVNFYRSKLQEECLRNNSREDDFDTICSAIQGHISKISRLFNISDQCSSYPSFDFNPEDNMNQAEKMMKNLSKLDHQLTKLEMAIISTKKQSEKLENLSKSLSSSMELTKINHQRQKDVISKQLEQLKLKYENKVNETEDYKHEISSILHQRTFTHDLLVTSEKQKISLFNEVHTIAKNQFRIDFQKMNKGQIIFLCLKLFTKIKDSEQIIENLRKKIQKFEQEEKDKYKKLLKDVRKSVNKSPQPRLNRLKKLQTMPVE